MEKIEDIWLCSLCVKDTKLWQKEDFDFEEEDRDANTVGTVKGKSKSANAKPKKNSIDLITLSSDEEEEDEDDDEDEVEFLAEMEGHFFGNQDTSEVKTNLQFIPETDIAKPFAIISRLTLEVYERFAKYR